jgi:hypothetical protein
MIQVKQKNKGAMMKMRKFLVGVVRKSASFFLLATALLLPSFLSAEEILIEVDFSKSGNEVQQIAQGSFTGTLPEGCSENFTHWTSSVATSSVLAEDGKQFTRFVVEKLDPAVQFMAPIQNIQIPGFYKMTVSLRVPASEFSVGVREIPAPYTMLWNKKLDFSKEWAEKTFVFSLETPSPSQFGLFFYLNSGITDVSRIKLVKLTKEEYVVLSASSILRPDKSSLNFFRNSRFPLGLQAGWNVGRDFTKGSVGADDLNLGPSGYPSLKIQSDAAISVYSEPFQTSDPLIKNQVSFAYKGAGDWEVSLMQDGKITNSKKFEASESWETEGLKFSVNPVARALCLKFSGNGILHLDSLRAYTGMEAHPYMPAGKAEVALAPVKSEISDTRIQFEDEPPKIKYCVTGDFEAAVLKARTTNLYGKEMNVSDVKLGEVPGEKGKSASGVIDFGVFPDTPYGQFRLEAWVEKDGERISPMNEIVITRLKRPRYWGKDAPHSPFGSHFLASPLTIKTMKAGGVNWARLHDAGTDYIGWFWLEPEKGDWKFRDDEINRYRENKIKIFAQLGTAPKWASYLSKVDTGRNWISYHDHYFQPLSLDDFANYAKTVSARYKGVIDEYFVWNEPWIKAWWGVAYDKTKPGTDGHITSEAPEADFAKLMKTAYQSVKSVDPTIKVSGFNTTSGSSGRNWTKGVFDAGGLDFCDMVDYHFYTPSDTGVPGDHSSAAYNDAIGYILKNAPDFAKPIYMSEGQGTSNGSTGDSCGDGLYKNCLTWKSEENLVLAADKTCRYVLSLLSEKVAKVFLYSAHCYQNMTTIASFIVLLGADGYPHPSLAAYSNMAWHLEDKKFVKVVPVGKNAFAYLFEGKDGTIAVISGTRDGIFAVPDSDDIIVSDLFGNPLQKEEKAEFNGMLIYLSSALPPDKLEELLCR